MSGPAQDTALLRQITRFGLVGIAATVTHLAVAWAANQFGAAPYTANAIGFAAAFGLSYAGHFFWTFERRTGHRHHLPKFLVISVGCYLVSNLMVWLITDLSALRFEIALAAILLTVPPTSLVLNRVWAFRAAG